MSVGLLGLLGLFAMAIVVVAVLYVVALLWRLRHPPRRTAGWAIARGRPLDPGAVGAAWREVEAAGLPLWLVARDEATLDRSDAPLAVLLHGWGNSRLDWLGRLEPWLSSGVRLAIPDLRGHGDAPGASTLGDADREDVLAILREIRAVGAASSPPLLLVGHSLGSVVALRVAAALGDHEVDLRGVVAFAPYERLRTPAVAELASREAEVGVLLPVLLAGLRLLGVREHSTSDAARAIRTPLVIVHGAEDPISPLEEAREIAAASPRAELLVLDGAGHLDLWSRPVDPASSAPSVEDLLRSRLEAWLR